MGQNLRKKTFFESHIFNQHTDLSYAEPIHAWKPLNDLICDVINSEYPLTDRWIESFQRGSHKRGLPFQFSDSDVYRNNVYTAPWLSTYRVFVNPRQTMNWTVIN